MFGNDPSAHWAPFKAAARGPQIIFTCAQQLGLRNLHLGVCGPQSKPKPLGSEALGSSVVWVPLTQDKVDLPIKADRDSLHTEITKIGLICHSSRRILFLY